MRKVRSYACTGLSLFVSLFRLTDTDMISSAGNDSAVRSVIFPVFVNVLWVNAAVNIFIGFIALSFNFALYHDDSDSVYSFSVMYGLQHLGD